MNLNYLTFHLVFTVPLVALLIYFRPELPDSRKKHFRQGTLLMILLSLIYTSPWDALLIEKGIWFYGEDVVSLWILGIPIGEYLFFTIQTVGTSLYLYHQGFNSDDTDQTQIFGDLKPALLFAGITATGFWLLIHEPQSFTYVGFILAWSGPVLTLQWAFGSQKLLEQKKTLFKAVSVPTVYLWVVDRIAIEKELWVLPVETRTGVELFGLPVEEALFFKVTNMMVVQGLILYEWTVSSRKPLDYIKNRINI